MKSLRKALEVLALFKDEQGSLGVNDIVEHLGHQKSYVSRVLSAMRDMDFLQQDPVTRKYTVGLEAFALGARFVADTPITRTALPVMREISNQTGDSVFLTMRHENLCRHILAIEGPYFTETRWRIGVRLPLHASASGKTLLAFSSQEDQQALLENNVLEQFTPLTITDPERLQEELTAIRERRYAISRGELVKGLAGWAVPVYRENETLIAALSIIMPEHVMADKDQEAIVRTLHDGARRLSSLCGARVYPR